MAILFDSFGRSIKVHGWDFGRDEAIVYPGIKEDEPCCGPLNNDQVKGLKKELDEMGTAKGVAYEKWEKEALEHHFSIFNLDGTVKHKDNPRLSQSDIEAPEYEYSNVWNGVYIEDRLILKGDTEIPGPEYSKEHYTDEQIKSFSSCVIVETNDLMSLNEPVDPNSEVLLTAFNNSSKNNFPW